jgi:hypothetical protein
MKRISSVSDVEFETGLTVGGRYMECPECRWYTIRKTLLELIEVFSRKENGR